jgi:hypothetical protein
MAATDTASAVATHSAAVFTLDDTAVGTLCPRFAIGSANSGPTTHALRDALATNYVPVVAECRLTVGIELGRAAFTGKIAVFVRCGSVFDSGLTRPPIRRYLHNQVASVVGEDRRSDVRDVYVDRVMVSGIGQLCLLFFVQPLELLPPDGPVVLFFLDLGAALLVGRSDLFLPIGSCCRRLVVKLLDFLTYSSLQFRRRLVVAALHGLPIDRLLVRGRGGGRQRFQMG